MKVGYPAGSRITDNNAGPVDSGPDLPRGVRRGHHQLGLALRFFVGISELLADINLRFQREVTLSGHIGRAHMLQSFGGSLPDNLEQITSPAHVHREDLIAVFGSERE